MTAPPSPQPCCYLTEAAQSQPRYRTFTRRHAEDTRDKPLVTPRNSPLGLGRPNQRGSPTRHRSPRLRPPPAVTSPPPACCSIPRPTRRPAASAYPSGPAATHPPPLLPPRRGGGETPRRRRGARPVGPAGPRPASGRQGRPGPGPAVRQPPRGLPTQRERPPPAPPPPPPQQTAGGRPPRPNLPSRPAPGGSLGRAGTSPGRSRRGAASSAGRALPPPAAAARRRRCAPAASGREGHWGAPRPAGPATSRRRRRRRRPALRRRPRSAPPVPVETEPRRSPAGLPPPLAGLNPWAPSRDGGERGGGRCAASSADPAATARRRGWFLHFDGPDHFLEFYAWRPSLAFSLAAPKKGCSGSGSGSGAGGGRGCPHRPP